MAGDDRCRSGQYLCAHLGLLRDTATGGAVCRATLPVSLLHYGSLPGPGGGWLGSLLGRTLRPLSLSPRSKRRMVHPRVYRAYAALPHSQCLRHPSEGERFARDHYSPIADAECLRLGNRPSQGGCWLLALLLHPTLSNRAIPTEVPRDLLLQG